MNIYSQVIKGTWEEYMTYRLNFVLWRVRMVLQLLVTYFLWWALFADRREFFGYTQTMILTYILLTSLARTIILSTRSLEIGDLINRGDLSNYLVRPMNFFRYVIARDVADKAINVGFAIIETSLLVLIFRPTVFIQTNPWIYLLALFAAAVGMVLYFSFSVILGLLGFWTPDIWAPRFLSFVIMEFFAGGLFPLDILPKPLFALAQALPFFYFIYFPIKVYLGQLSSLALVQGFFVGALWVGGFWYLVNLLWRRGLKVYTAEGK